MAMAPVAGAPLWFVRRRQPLPVPSSSVQWLAGAWHGMVVGSSAAVGGTLLRLMHMARGGRFAAPSRTHLPTLPPPHRHMAVTTLCAATSPTDTDSLVPMPAPSPNSRRNPSAPQSRRRRPPPPPRSPLPPPLPTLSESQPSKQESHTVSQSMFHQHLTTPLPAEIIALAVDVALVLGGMLHTAPTEQAVSESSTPCTSDQCKSLLREISEDTQVDMIFGNEQLREGTEDLTWSLKVEDPAGMQTLAPVVAISAASTESKDPSRQIGVVYDPFRDELFTAISGRGAELNGAPLQISATQKVNSSVSLRNAFVGAHPTESPYYSRPCLQALYTLGVPRSAGVCIFGSTAQSLAWLACGRLDAFFVCGCCNDAGSTAGALLVQEAGGCITDCDGNPIQAGGTFASLCAARNPGVHAELLGIVQQAIRNCH